MINPYEIILERLDAIQNKLGEIDLLNERSKFSNHEADRWLNLTELCTYLPDKPVKPTVYGWVHLGQIPNHKKGKSLYFLKSEIDEWLKKGRKKTTAEISSEADKYLQRRGVAK